MKTTPTQTVKCAQCAREFAGQPVASLGARGLVCCSQKCHSELAVRELERMEGWLALIMKKSRGAAGDMAGVALRSNQVAFRKVKI